MSDLDAEVFEKIIAPLGAGVEIKPSSEIEFLAQRFYQERIQEKQMDNRFKKYRKQGTTLLRPYEVGEDLTGVSVSEKDTPELGGMIAYDPKDGARWYVSKDYYNTNYELAE